MDIQYVNEKFSDYLNENAYPGTIEFIKQFDADNLKQAMALGFYGGLYHGRTSSWHEITEPPEYDREIIIEYENGAHEIFYFWATSWEGLVTEIAMNCNEYTGLPQAWTYVPGRNQ